MYKIPLYIDFDNTLVDTTKTMIQCYEHLTGEYPLTYDDYTWNLKTAYPNYDKKIIHKLFDIPLFFQYVTNNIFINAIQILDSLTSYYDIYIVSCGTNANLTLKKEWCDEHIPFAKFIGLNQSNKIFDKSTVCKNGVLIDDRLDCLTSSNDCLNILFRYNNNPYEWQNGYKELMQQGKIDYVATEWNKNLKYYLMNYVMEKCF